MRTPSYWIKHLAILSIATMPASVLARVNAAEITSIEPFKGQLVMEDIDSFWIDGAHVRVNGIDGPEINNKEEPAGNAAVVFLYTLVRGKTLECVWNGDMNHGRFITVCKLPDGRDLGEAVVRAGYAHDCKHFSSGRYASAEADAKRANRGLWGTGQMPPYTKRYCN